MRKTPIKKYEKRMVKIANKEISSFIKAWKKDPYLWETETDVHAELYWRIKSAINKSLPISISDRRISPYDHMIKKEKFNLIYCKPVAHTEKVKFPDLVIFKLGGTKIDDLLWVCEIKYATEWSSEITRDSIKYDIKKLKKFIKKKRDDTNADYASLIVLYRWMYKYDNKIANVNEYKKKKKWEAVEGLIKRKKLKQSRIRPHFASKIQCG